MAPAFTTKTSVRSPSLFIQVDEINFHQSRYGTVLQQTTNLYQDMLQKEGWEGKTDFVVNSVNRLTLRVSITPNFPP